MTPDAPAPEGAGEPVEPGVVEPDPVGPDPVGPDPAEPEVGEPDVIEPERPAPLVIKRRGRRVSTEPAPGYLGEPAREQQQSSENDQRLKGDVPPHWG